MKKILTATSGALLLTLSLTPPAFAGDNDSGAGSGRGGCVGGRCTNTGPFTWNVTQSEPGRSAWDKFVGTNGKPGLSGMMPNTAWTHIKRDITPAGGQTQEEFIKRCKNSKYIWWVSGSGKLKADRAPLWGWNYGGQTFPSTSAKGPGSSFTDAAGKQWTGPGMDQSLKQKANQFVKSAGGDTNPVLVCSNQFDDVPGFKDPGPTPKPTPPPTPKTPPVPNQAIPPQNPDSDLYREQWGPICEAHYEKPYQYKMDVKLGLPEDFVGEANLHDQTVVRKTEYGKEVDKINSGFYDKTECQVVINAVEAALKKDAQNDHIRLNYNDDGVKSLDAANKAGMAEGGVLDFYEFTKTAKVDIFQQYRQFSTRTKSTREEGYWDGNKWVHTGWRTIYSPWTPWKDINQFPPSKRQYDGFINPNFKNTGFWQMLSVHCNLKGFQEAVAAAGAQVVSSNVSEGYISSAAITPLMPSAPASRAWGEAYSPTGQEDFYTKECAFDCVKDASPATGKTEMTGAQGNEKADPAGKMPNGDPASQSSLSSNKFIFFRDNTEKFLNVDVWRPKSSRLVQGGGEAISTTVSRWPEGTPGITPGENGNGGVWELKLDGVQMFTPGSTQAPIQQNFTEPEGWTNSTSGQLEGEHNKFTTQASWASNEGKPEVFNVKWEFEPQTQLYFHDAGGFDKDGKRKEGGVVPEATAIQGKCYAEAGRSSTTALTKMVDLQQQNTGYSTPNGLDGKLVDAFHDAFRGPGAGPTNFHIKFVRSTTE